MSHKRWALLVLLLIVGVFAGIAPGVACAPITQCIVGTVDSVEERVANAQEQVREINQDNAHRSLDVKNLAFRLVGYPMKYFRIGFVGGQPVPLAQSPAAAAAEAASNEVGYHIGLKRTATNRYGKEMFSYYAYVRWWVDDAANRVTRIEYTDCQDYPTNVSLEWDCHGHMTHGPGGGYEASVNWHFAYRIGPPCPNYRYDRIIRAHVNADHAFYGTITSIENEDC